MSDFPVLDSNRSETPGRVIVDVFGNAEPYIDGLDSWCALPVRLVHTPGDDFSIEIGPYTFSAADIYVLRKAVAAYADAVGRPVRPAE